MDQPLRLVSETAVAQTSASFEDFVVAEHERLHGALCLVTGDRDEADEIAQEAFVRILERWDRVQAMESPTGYLYRTAMNVFRQRYRRAVRALRRATTLAPSADAFAAVEDRDVVVRALAKLPIDQRAALVVTTLLGYTSEEAARVLGTRPSTVRARATRARAALREAIGEER
jgi:RNA polymerase sigma-70 factor (ECF subfamily)